MHNEANRFSREISAFFDSYFEEHKLATSYIEVVLTVFEAGSMTQKELGKTMNLAPSTITRFIHKLEKQGYITKKKEGRIAKISLTKKGSAITPILKETYQKAESDLMKLLGEKFVDTTRQLLDHGAELMNNQA